MFSIFYFISLSYNIIGLKKKSKKVLPPRDWKTSLSELSYLTINTDASFHPISKKSGFAFYIVCNSFKIQKSGNFNTGIDDSLMAETKCIGNAIATTLGRKDLPQVKNIIINTDCLSAVSKINNSSEEYCVKIRELIEKLKTRTNCVTFKFKHVKAHSNKNDARSWVNDWCDKEAKKMMRKN